MGFLDRMLGRTIEPAPIRVESRAPVNVLGGSETLEVVGESFHQDDLWLLVGGFTPDRVRCDVVAMLVPEPENPVDENAVQVLIEDVPVGHLSREDAAVYLAGVSYLISTRGTVALRGQIVGGG